MTRTSFPPGGADAADRPDPGGRPSEVFRAFLKLGLTSFGGPVAHLGYFRDEFVLRRRWLDEAGYADLVALCQFLPGPASSQVGFALGLLRGGIPGALAAWCAFTLPSAALLVLFAAGAGAFGGVIGEGAVHGLKLVAVAVVAQAVWGMARSLTPDRPRAAIALAALLVVIFAAGSTGQVAAILAGAVLGLRFCREAGASVPGHLAFPVSRRAGLIALALFVLLLAGLPLAAAASGQHGVALFDVFYRAGALVFGGGHVVLPLLEAAVVQPGWIGSGPFLAGYGAAQAVPGPLFSFVAFLGAAMAPAPAGIIGATICLVAIFTPGLLLVVAALPFWNGLRGRPLAQAAMRGMNAAVVGILGAAFYDPVWTGAVQNPRDFAVALVGFALLVVWKVPPWVVVLLTEASGVALALL
ncbi:chromate efflux transporter [Bosea sp. (in: a-proteobacteria)]|uniref:chromate efflux transporter n=1 Tax=Bosea sp. (in: a-proteobacteria) TaxID=1871050 RepID=UPI003340C8FC